MADAFDNAWAEIERRLTASMDAYGKETVAMIQQGLDVDFPPASVEGEWPHKRTGNLQKGVSCDPTYRNADSLVLTIRSERVEGDPTVPWVLNCLMGRPYWSESLVLIHQDAAKTILAGMKG